MRVWHCSYDWYGSYGAYQRYEYICIADTKDEAIQMAMNDSREGGKDRSNWGAVEIDITTKAAHYISQRGN